MARSTPSFVLLTLAIMALSACSKAPEPDTRRLVLVTQASGSNTDNQAFPGEVRARQEVALSFRVPGKIANRYVDAGVRVKAGEVLARLDDSDLVLQSQASTASLQALKADRDLAAAELKRYSELVGPQLVSKSLYESKKAQAEAAQSRYQQAAAQAKVNSNQAGYAEIRAPAAGVISQRLAEAGQVVAAGQTVFNFAQDGARDIAITVAERHLSELSLGQAVGVELWTEPGKLYPGKVREIAAAADPMTRTYAVRVALDDADALTQLGQSARVLISNNKNSTLTIPMSALTEANGKPAVWVFNPKDGKLTKQPVRVIGYGAQQAKIGAGLQPDQWIVQAGVHMLREGETVRAVDADNRPVAMVAKP
jgi:multidrug efflux system membrane fusion protein